MEEKEEEEEEEEEEDVPVLMGSDFGLRGREEEKSTH